MPGSNNGACQGAAMGHAREQQWGMPWSNNGAYFGVITGHARE